MSDLNAVPSTRDKIVSIDEMKYPPLCRRCEDIVKNGGYCGVMMEAIREGALVMNCAYYKRRKDPAARSCDTCGKLLCKLKNAHAHIQGCKDHVDMDIAARAYRDEPENEKRIRGMC
jgi:hypothetical protein